jgi:hypothetical protein
LAPDLFVGFKSRLALSILAWLAYSFISIWQYLLVCCSSVYSLVTYVFSMKTFWSPPRDPLWWFPMVDESWSLHFVNAAPMAYPVASV